MKLNVIILAILSFIFVILSGCDSNDKKTTYTHLRITHASVDAPVVMAEIDGVVVADDSLDYADSSGETRYKSGEHTISVDAMLPDGSAATVLGPITDTFSKDVLYDVFAIGSVGGDSLEAFVFSRDKNFDNSQVRVSVLHLSPDAPMVDVYVTAPMADLTMASPLGSFSYKETLGPVEVAAGDYQIRVTIAGSTTVVFDSGTLPLSAGQDLVVAAIPNPQLIADTAASKSPVQLLVLEEDSVASISSVGDGADLRVVHNAADAPAVDVVVNDNFVTPLVEDLAFPAATAYVNVPADEYNVKVAAANTQTAVIDADLSLDNAMIYTVIALNTLTNIEPLVLPDMPRRVATEAKLRAIHGSTLAGDVDVYVTAEGADIVAATPALTGFSFKDDSGYISLPAGSYDITVTPAGSKDVALGPLAVSLNNAGIYTVLARDEAMLSGVTVTLLDDFNQ